MKRLLILASAALLLVQPAQAQVEARKRALTDHEIMYGLPKGIVNPIGYASSFVDNDNLLMYEPDGQYCKVNVVTNEKSPVPTPSAMKPMPQLVEGWVNPTWSPDSSRIAYTFDNDLYTIEVASKKITRLTTDGSELILNGYASWVYYEEILGRPSRYKAFWWSPDSKVIAYYRFDNTNVPMFPIYNSKGTHGSLNRTRYPKAGDPNPEVKVGFVSAAGGSTVWADFNEKEDQYFGIPFWNGEGTRFMVAWMDRSQDNMVLYEVEPSTGSKNKVYTEHQESWIDWMEEMLFTPEGIYIVRDYEMWQQIYFLSYDGKKYERLTDGGQNWNIHLLKVDKKYLFYTAKREATTRNDIYRISLRDKKVERVSYGDLNFANVLVSPDNKRIFATASNSKTPSQNVVITLPGGNVAKKSVKVLADSKGTAYDSYEIAVPEIITVTMRDGVKLPASVIWPVNLDKSRKYPVHVYIYGGPDNPQVSDVWRTPSFANQWWANHGVIQVILDNRAGGHLGKGGLNQVYRHLADLEIDDFIDGIKYFRALPYVDEEKIGIEGFSFGGTMTTLAVTEGNDYFKYGIAGGAVSDWGLYDSHYTERYMDTPQTNPDGYGSTKLCDRISKYKGDKSNMLRLTHGTGDDNVHFQNCLQLIDAFQKQKKNFELMIYPEGMHGYRGYQKEQSNLQDYIFWYKYLLDSDIPLNLRNYFEN